MFVDEIHLGEGGPLRRFEAFARVTSLRRQLATAVAVTWLPLVVLGLVTENITHDAEAVVRNLSVHVRLLVATPAFLTLDQVFLHACRATVEQLATGGFIRTGDQPRLNRLLSRATHLADARLPEALLAALALLLGGVGLSGAVPIGGLAHGDAVTPCEAWYALVGWPFFQFLLWRSLWRWVIWAGVIIGLSRMDLELVPAHPDRRAGIGFMSQPSVDYCGTFLFAVSSVLSAEWGTELAFVSFFEPLVLALAVLGLVLAFGPLAFFAPSLERARRAGLAEGAAVANDLGRRFRRAWVEREAFGAAAEPVAHLTVIYRATIEQLWPILFYKRDLVFLLAATLLPVVPVMVVQIPREEWLMLVGLITGGAGR